MIRIHITIPEELDERIRLYGKENNLILLALKKGVVFHSLFYYIK